MKSFIFLVYATLLLFASNITKAQDFADYAIPNKGDTIHCKISVSLFGAISYEAPGMEGSKRIKPAEFKEYNIFRKKQHYASVYREKNRKPEFMEVVEKGSINLYEVINYVYSQYGSTTTTNWFVSKGSDTVTILKTSGLFATRSKQKRKDKFSDMLKDKPDIYNKYIAEDKFSFKQIQNLVHLYNTGEPLQE